MKKTKRLFLFSFFVIFIIVTYSSCINDKKHNYSNLNSDTIPEDFNIQPEPKYYLIAGSYTTLKAAQSAVDSLKAIGYQSELVGKNNIGGIRICFSSYENYTDAITELNRIKKDVTKNVWLYDAKSELANSSNKSDESKASTESSQSKKTDSLYLDNWEKEYKKSIDSAMSLINNIGNDNSQNTQTKEEQVKDNNTNKTTQYDTFEETVDANSAVVITRENSSRNWCILKAKDNYCLYLDGNLDSEGRYIIDITYSGCYYTLKLPFYLGDMSSFSFRNFTYDDVTIVFSACSKVNK